ncbi:MAG: hypothetical protein ACXAAH_15725, partial [Promethearchaeota archaeon]
RYNHGTRESRKFLILEGYLKNLSEKEKRELKEDKHIPLLEFHRFDRYRYRKMKTILYEYNEITQEKKLKPLSREGVDKLLDKFKELDTLPKRVEINGKMIEVKESIENDEDLFFALVEGAIKKIAFLMKEQSVDELVIHRQYLLEVFNHELLMLSDDDGYPEFKPGIIKCFEVMGIDTISEDQVVRLFKISVDNHI